MKQHHIKKKAKGYFEGWYFKHQKGEQMIAFIPSVSFNKQGQAEAFIQVISNADTWNIPYPYDAFSVCDDHLEIEIGENKFSENGIKIQIDTPELKCSGSIQYGPLQQPHGDIMGPFAILPGMQCNHGLVSLYHTLRGTLNVNGEEIDFTGGKGYIEKDWGKSFPKGYTWFHSSDFAGDKPTSVMAAVADVPLGPGSIRGVIASVFVDGKEHRLATYNGCKVIKNSCNEIMLERGRDKLSIQVRSGQWKPLHAPDMGEMSRVIKERPSCEATVTFQQGDEVVFSEISKHASFESVHSEAQ